jgi:hypothetical protein
MPITLNGNTGIVGPDGSASTPAIQGSDSNTGVFFPAADTIAFATAGTEDMRITPAGDVGIGTTSPTDTGGYGRVLDINSSTGAGIALRSNGSATNVCLLGQLGGTTYLENRGAGSIQIYNNGSERARIDSSGNLLVGTTSQVGFNGGAGANINANGAFRNGVSGSGDSSAWQRSSTGNYLAFFYGALNSNPSSVGSINTNGTNTTYSTSSDYRLKEDIAPMTGALAKVAALKPVTYKWKSTGEASEGFIAHELAEVCPQAVVGDKDAVNKDGSIKPQGIDTSFLVATLTAAIQELTARVAALEGAQT